MASACGWRSAAAEGCHRVPSGHEPGGAVDPPLVRLPADGGVRRLDDVGGVPLGVLDPVKYEESVVELSPGQTMLLYTDGITDARAPDGTMFGLQRVEEALERCAGEPHAVVRSIIDPLARHTAGIRPGDDQTIVAIRAE